jgi:hypothetical protein
MFRRIITQTIFLEVPYYKGYIMAPNIEHTLGPFSSITQAHECLEDIYTLIHHHSRSIRHNASKIPYQGPEKHMTLLHRWHTYFLNLITLRRTHFTPKESTGATILQLHYIALFIMSATALDTSPEAFETFTPSFSRIIALTEHLLKPCPSSQEALFSAVAPAALPKFSFDMGVIPPLYYTALRCRSSAVRWKAIALLQQAPLREGIWGAAMTANMARKFVEVEEDNATKAEAAAMASVYDIPGIRGLKGVSDGELGRDRYLTVRFSMPSAYERLIKMHIGKMGLKNGGREEVVTW